jgi:hypothetical protein
MQELFNVHKSLDVIQKQVITYINRSKDKSHLTISIDEQKT